MQARQIFLCETFFVVSFFFLFSFNRWLLYKFSYALNLLVVSSRRNTDDSIMTYIYYDAFRYQKLTSIVFNRIQ